MSNEERQEQHLTFKKIENVGFKVTVMQLITIVGLLLDGFLWYQNHEQKSLLDSSALSNKIDNVLVYVRNSHATDSIKNQQQRKVDSLLLNNKFSDLKLSIVTDINHKLALHEHQISELENRSTWVREIKKHGASGPVTLQNVSNR